MDLGKYLKDLRVKKGSSLRKVESETGVKNAHLSQIERGEIKQPSEELLEKLARYYNVDLEELNSLLGGIPEKIKQRPYTPQKYVSASSLDEFSNKRAMEGLLPEIVRSLIVATVNFEHLAMPSGESVFIHGWDGLLECKAGFGSPFVPDGLSCWEMGRSKDFKTKANSDIRTRSENPKGLSKKDATFIFVTSRRWINSDAWCEEKKNKYGWKDVRVIDAEKLELWLESSSVIALRLAREMGRFPLSGALSLKDFWSEWFASTDPGIDETLLLEAGQGHRKGLEEFFSSEKDVYKLNTYDQDVAVAFVFAVLTSLGSQLKTSSFISRTIVTRTEEAFRELAVPGNPKVFIALFENVPVSLARLYGHKVIVPVLDFQGKSTEVIRRVSSGSVQEYLQEEGGFSEVEAKRLSAKTHGNLKVLKQLLGELDVGQHPVWAKPEIGAQLAPYVLFGSWNLNNRYDVDFLEELLKKTREEIEKELSVLLNIEHSPLKEFNGTYMCYQEYAFSYLFKFLNDSFISDFLNISGLVLGDFDDSYELSQDERISAHIYGKGVSFSDALREGIGRTFALLGNLEPVVSSPWKHLLTKALERIYSEFKGWKYWASLSDILVLLAEADPEKFLNSLEEALNDDFGEIFKEGGGLGRCEYASILWALEMCGWEERFILQTTRILFKLTHYEDKKSNQVNQPSNSLWGIYRIYRPQTSCSFEDKMKVLHKMEEHYQEEVFNLMVSIVPGDNHFFSDSYRARFRDYFGSPDEIGTYAELYERGELVCADILRILAKKPELWKEAVDLIFRMPMKGEKKKFFKHLINASKDVIAVDTEGAVWKKLEEELSSHLEFQDATWSFKGELMAMLRSAYDSLTPDDPVQRWLHVFDYSVKHPDVEKISGDYQKRHEEVLALQLEALNEIIKKYGKGKVFEIVTEVPSPDRLGTAYAKLLSSKEAKEFLSSYDFNDDQLGTQFFKSVVSSIYFSNGGDWFENFLAECSLDIKRKSMLFQSVEFKQEIWDLVSAESEELQKDYWKSVQGYYYLKDLESCLIVIDKMMEHNRPFIAFEVMVNLDFKAGLSEEIPTQTAMEVLNSLLQADFSSGDWRFTSGSFGYHLEKALEALSKRKDVVQRDLGLVEWGFIDFFRYDKTPKNLTQTVNEDPSMFVEILSLAYKVDVDLRAEELDEEVNQSAAQRAYKFLHGYKKLPGATTTGELDAAKFREWIVKARDLSKQKRRGNIGDYVLGTAFAYSPHDPDDGKFPHLAVRDVIEASSSDNMERGFYFGIINKRGVYKKSCYEGGVQERELSERYRGYANALERLWPKTAGVLHEIADSYSRDADREDVRAERDRFKHD